MRSSKSWLEDRAEPLGVMESLLETAQAEKRAMTGEEQETFDRADEAQKLSKLMSDQAVEYETARGLVTEEEVPTDGSGVEDLIPTGRSDGLSVDDQENALRAWMLGGTESQTRDERELCERAGLDSHANSMWLKPSKRMIRQGFPKSVAEAKLRREETRAMAAETATAGLEFVADEAIQAVHISLLAWGGMLQTSTVITPATAGDLKIPTSTDTGNTGEIVGENTEANEQNITTADITLSPFLYSSKYVRASIQFMQDSSVNPAEFIGDILGTRIGRKQNTDFTVGAGTTEPNGIAARAADSGVTAATLNTLTFAEVMQIKHSVNRAYRAQGAAFMCSDTVLRIMKTMGSEPNTHRPLWLPAITPGQPDLFDGDPVIVNDDVANATATKFLLYGKLDEYMIDAPLGIQIMRLNERWEEFHQVGFLAFARADGNLIDTAAVKYGTNG